jgi:poly(3-hydroxybutyrate) depolymerase
MTSERIQLQTFGATLALVPLWLLASCGGGGATDSSTQTMASATEAVSVQLQSSGRDSDGHGSQGGADDHHGNGDHDDGGDCDHRGHGDGDHHDGQGVRKAHGGGSDESDRWHDSEDDDHGKHHGRGKKCKPPKPDSLPQLPPAQPAPLPVTCEQLAATLGATAASPLSSAGRAGALAVKPAAGIGPLAGGTPVPNPIDDTVITTTTTVPPGTLTVGGQPVAEHCVVTGKMFERVSPVDNKTYAIGFEMRLPKNWNGRFWHQGNGGIDGSVATASGTFGGGPLTSALLQGFAVLSSDAGHTLAQGGPAFGVDPQARLDYGYQAVGKLTPMAKKLIELAYGKAPDRSYFGGCSNGGRHTLVAAARYAADYDGFLAGAPGFNLPIAALANIFGAQRYATIATGDPTTPAGLETAFTAAERKTVANAVLERCDALDGVTDGLVQDTNACQRRFRLFRDVPTCSGARDGSCLSLAQKIAIAPIFRGATLANGERFYARFPYDSGLSGGGIPFWEFTAPLVLDSGAVGIIFGVPPKNPVGFNGAAFSLDQSIDTLYASLYAKNDTYTEAAMTFMTPPNATDVLAVRNRGGKILVYHGVSDAIFSVADTAAWYDGVAQTSGGYAGNFARLFRVPGMGHCSGGPSTDQFDLITPLVAWVEQGDAPRRITATARGAGNAGAVNTEVPATWAADRTRPLCPYPEVARYRGFGDVEAQSSYRCR